MILDFQKPNPSHAMALLSAATVRDRHIEPFKHSDKNEKTHHLPDMVSVVVLPCIMTLPYHTFGCFIAITENGLKPLLTSNRNNSNRNKGAVIS